MIIIIIIIIMIILVLYTNCIIVFINCITIIIIIIIIVHENNVNTNNNRSRVPFILRPRVKEKCSAGPDRGFHVIYVQTPEIRSVTWEPAQALPVSIAERGPLRPARPAKRRAESPMTRMMT